MLAAAGNANRAPGPLAMVHRDRNQLPDRCAGASDVQDGGVSRDLIMRAVQGDSPIQSAEEDLLGRQTAAEVLADEIRVLDCTDGYVVGVLGAWGSGKTSLVNLVRAELVKRPALTIVDFNPWMFRALSNSSRASSMS